MFSPLDKQQERTLLPVDCQQDKFSAKQRRLLRRLAIDGRSPGVAAYACHSRYGPRNSNDSCPQGADHP